jgi:flagellin
MTSDTAAGTSTAAVTVTGIAASGAPVIAGSFGFAAGTPSTTNITGRTVDAMVASINTILNGQVRASNDNGRLRIENLSTAALSLAGYNTTTGEIDGTAGSSSIVGNDVRVNFVKQFNGYIDQLNKLSDDASFNGVNLLRGDKLKITFNEAGTSTIEIQAKDANGNPIAINTSTLGILQATNPEFDNDDLIDAKLTILGDALASLRAQGSSFGSNLSIVQNRQDFTKAMINTLETGGDNLVLADSNEEGANMLALQTRQQLSTTALSLSAQADQAVLRLFG